MGEARAGTSVAFDVDERGLDEAGSASSGRREASLWLPMPPAESVLAVVVPSQVDADTSPHLMSARRSSAAEITDRDRYPRR